MIRLKFGQLWYKYFTFDNYQPNTTHNPTKRLLPAIAAMVNSNSHIGTMDTPLPNNDSINTV